MVSAGTVVVVRQAIGGGDVVNALSQSDVRSQYATADGRPSRRIGGAGATPTTPSRVTSTAPSHHPGSTSPTRPSGGHSSTGSADHQGSGSGASHPTGSTSTHSPTSSGAITRVLTTSGGSVVVQCSSATSSGTVYLVSWSPAQGYRVDDVRRGPGQEASLDLEGTGGSLSITYGCDATGPTQHVEHDDGGGDGAERDG
jgi:hypothetical protein